jgi:hypothetical protein
MKSSINAGCTKAVGPELTHLAPKHDLDFTTDKAVGAETATKLIVRFSREPEMPLPMTLVEIPHAARLNSFRGFGINE